MINWLKDKSEIEDIQKKHSDFFVLMFYGDFSDAAKQALSEMEKCVEENEDMVVYVVDVQKIKGLHKEFDVESVPTVIVLKNGRVVHRIEGVQNHRFYERVILEISAPPASSEKNGKKSKTVVVYTGEGCPACGSAKRYLRKNRIRFREVNIGKDEQAAKRLAARTGRMAVPQIDIDGEIVVGFDQAKIDRLLSQ